MPSYDEALAGALAAGLSQRRAATVAGVSKGTVWARLQDPTFRALVEAKQDGTHDPLKETLYDVIEELRAVYATVAALDSTQATVAADQARAHLLKATDFLEEWVWTLETSYQW